MLVRVPETLWLTTMTKAAFVLDIFLRLKAKTKAAVVFKFYSGKGEEYEKSLEGSHENNFTIWKTYLLFKGLGMHDKVVASQQLLTRIIERSAILEDNCIAI